MLKLVFVTPEKRIVVGQQIQYVNVPALNGELSIHLGHAPLVTTLETGVVSWKLANEDVLNKVVVTGGYCEVGPEEVCVLADFADLKGDFERVEAESKIEKLNHSLSNEILDDVKYEELLNSVKRLQLYKTI